MCSAGGDKDAEQGLRLSDGGKLPEGVTSVAEELALDFAKLASLE